MKTEVEVGVPDLEWSRTNGNAFRVPNFSMYMYTIIRCVIYFSLKYGPVDSFVHGDVKLELPLGATLHTPAESPGSACLRPW